MVFKEGVKCLQNHGLTNNKIVVGVGNPVQKSFYVQCQLSCIISALQR